MTDEEVDEFLASAGYGTLAFAGDPPYAVPMSYGFDPEERVAYVHMGAFAGSEKMDRLEESSSVSLVVSRYRGPDQWRSAVVDGTLHPISSRELDDGDALEAFSAGDLASITLFDRDPGTVSFEWDALDPTAITGRRSHRPL
ncbi:MAG: pyridoxamine 5'-phosphate oxidase family protein [Halanaeroarchaeum sp.]